MQFTVVALAALAAVASAASNGTVVYTTEVHTAYTTYCPYATEITMGGKTYTVSEATTLTITSCPGGCTVVTPVTTTSSVAVATPAPAYSNSTTVVPPVAPATPQGGSVGTTSVQAAQPSSTAPIAASSGNKVFAFSGASLAGLLGLAAYVL